MARPQYGILEPLNFSVKSLRSSAVFRGAAPTPLTLPYLLCTWPRTRAGVNKDKLEVTTILYFER